MRLLRDIATDILKAGIPRPPEPIRFAIETTKGAIDDGRQGSEAVTEVVDVISGDTPRRLAKRYRNNLDRVRLGAKIVDYARKSRRRK